ncbi:MAG: hypothetical protein R2991_13855 [Thermoanaerobaculia bacterium]
MLRASTLRTVEIFSLVLLLYYRLARLVAVGFRRLERRLGAEGSRSDLMFDLPGRAGDPAGPAGLSS